MKDKLEVGMYYRYKGIIGKYYKPDLGKPFFTNQHKYTYNEIANYGKFSHNIIDLIEVGDYVNGAKVIEIEKDYKFIDNEIRDILWLDNKRNNAVWKETIKSIVAKEIFSSMEYRLGGK